MIALFLRKFWPHIIIAILVITILSVVNHWHENSKKLAKVQHDFDVYKERVETSEKTKKEVSDGFKSEVTQLHADIKPAPIIRMCNPQRAVPDNRPSSGDNGSAPATGSIPETTGLRSEAGPNIGPDLYGSADRADVLSAQLRAAQAYIKKLQEQSK